MPDLLQCTVFACEALQHIQQLIHNQGVASPWAQKLREIPRFDSRGVQADLFTNPKDRGFGFEIVVIFLPLLSQIEILSHELIGFAECGPPLCDELIAGDEAVDRVAIHDGEWDRISRPKRRSVP